ncbi:MAG: TetR/AcrR family transcriptional regulator [Candidatus Thorarchaeota archaeon]
MSSENSTNRQILDCAYDLFIEKGFQGSSMRDIAEKAGIKAASLYNHFRNKEQIFKEVFIERHPLFRILSILDGAIGETAEEILTDAVDRLHRELKDEPNILNLFFVELVEMKGKHIPEAIETNFPFDSAFMRQIFEKKPELRNIREPVLIRALIGTVFTNFMFNWFVGDSKPKFWGSQSEMTDVLLRGILEEQ